MKDVSSKLWIWKGALKTQKGESCTKRLSAKLPSGWSEFRRTYGIQYRWYKQTGRIIHANSRRSNETTPRKDRNLSKERIEYPLFEGRSGQNNYLVKDKFKARGEHWRK